MYLVEIFLPLNNPPEVQRLVVELAENFGGATAHLRAPADGLWSGDDRQLEYDRIGVIEVMVDELDKDWWGAFRARLETSFNQEEILIRASKCDRL